MKVCLFFILIFSYSLGFSQSAKKIYKLYNSREFVKCVQKSDDIIKKYPEYYEAYYVKAIAYFEMAQLPQRYREFTRDPLMDCIRTLSVLRTKDPDGTTFDEHSDTLAMIYTYTDGVAKELRRTNKDKSILLYQRLLKAYDLPTNNLELARIYANAGDYGKCMSLVSRIYEKHKPDISSQHDDYDVLRYGAVLLADNWMFKDLFWIVKTYKDKYQNNRAISKGFKKAIKMSIDTARHDSDISYFQSFSKEALELYPNDPEMIKHVENRWVEIINKNTQSYRATEGKRTWRDSVLLRDSYKYLELAKEIMPTSQVFADMEQKLNREFHTVPFSSEEVFFRMVALEIINEWRTEGCVCDTGRLTQIPPVPEVQWLPELEILAKNHAKEMFCYNYTDNINLARQTPWDRIKETDYKGTNYESPEGLRYKQALSIVEALGYGVSFDGVYTDEEMRNVIDDLIRNWIDAPLAPNCTKVMAPEITHIGLGMFGDKWVLFGANIHDIMIRANKKR